MKPMLVLWQVFVLVTLVGIWIETIQISRFNWSQNEMVEQLMPPTRYQGVVYYVVGKDTLYEMTPLYYDYKTCSDICDIMVRKDEKPEQGYDSVFYRIVTDCPSCQD